MTNTVQVQVNSVDGGLKSLRKGLQTTIDIGGNDPFLQIIQSMVEGMQVNSVSEGSVQENTQEEVTGDDEQKSVPVKAMDEIFAMLGGGADIMQIIPMLNALVKNEESPLSGIVSNDVLIAAINSAQNNPEAQAILSEAVNNAQTLSQALITADGKTQETPQVAEASAQSIALPIEKKPSETKNPLQKEMGKEETVEVIGSKSAEHTSKTELLEAERNVRNAVTSVKERTKKTSENTDEPLDVDKLQAQVNSKKATFSDIAALKTDKTQQVPVTEQLKEELKTQLAKGVKEFTMKLKPQSLGEITVKLTEVQGKLSLSILTASSQTAKLINNDLVVLREALTPMQVEVREAVEKTSGSDNGAFSMDMTGREFSGGQRSFENGENKPQYYVSDIKSDVSVPTPTQSDAPGINTLDVVL